MSLRLVATASAALALAATAEDLPTPEHVQIPVEVYTQLIDASRDPSRVPRCTPAGYALGNAKVRLTVQSATGRASGEARVELAIDVFEDQWVLVPVLPAGTPVESAMVRARAARRGAVGPRLGDEQGGLVCDVAHLPRGRAALRGWVRARLAARG